MGLTLGISAYFHDSAAAITSNGEILGALQEERLSRIKQDARFPELAIVKLFRDLNLSISQFDSIVFYEKPLKKFERILEQVIVGYPTTLNFMQNSFPIWLRNKVFVRNEIKKRIKKIFGIRAPQIYFSEHHLSHAASAFFPSPYIESAILTLDGVGEYETTAIFHGLNNDIKKLKVQEFPHSLGFLYSAFTQLCGFKVNSGEYKLMGLAPYGKPTYTEKILNNVIDLKEDGSFWLNMNYFDFISGRSMISSQLEELFQVRARAPESEISSKYIDLARSIQDITNEIVLRTSRHALNLTGSKSLCLAGGVALNCVANGFIHRKLNLSNIWIQPAAGDAGGALGAALAYDFMHKKTNRTSKTLESSRMKNAFLGGSYTHSDINEQLKKSGIKYKKIQDLEIRLSAISEHLAAGLSVGVFYGRSEFGPRSLGNRSILADARNVNMQKKLNLQTKFRESFRPFAPIILSENAADFFDLKIDSPFMLLVDYVKTELRKNVTENMVDSFGDLINSIRSNVPAVTHVDYSARIQTISEDDPTISRLILENFYQLTGYPILVNTSFNVRGEPIVESPQDAIRCFLGTGIDVLLIEDCLAIKSEQPLALLADYRHFFTED